MHQATWCGKFLYELQRKECQCNAEHQYQTGLPQWAQPDQKSCAKKLSRHEHKNGPHQRGSTCDEEKTIEREPQNTCGQIGRQTGPWQNATEDQNGIPSSGKPTLALFHSAREPPQRSALKPSAPNQPRQPVK